MSQSIELQCKTVERTTGQSFYSNTKIGGISTWDHIQYELYHNDARYLTINPVLDCCTLLNFEAGKKYRVTFEEIV